MSRHRRSSSDAANRPAPAPGLARAAGGSRSFRLAILVSLALLAFVLRAASLDAQSLWRDEVDALRFASAPLEEVLSNFTRYGWNGPLYFLVLRGWVALTGTSAYAMRFLSLVFGVLCVPLAYALGCRLFNPPAGIFAALLVAASPYLTWYSQEVKMYSLVPALVLLAIYGLRRAVTGDGRRWWGVQVAATGLAVYTHIIAALLIPVQVLIYFTWWPQARGRWRGALISLACLTLPYLPLAGWQMDLLFQDEVGRIFRSPGQIVPTLLAGWRAGNFLLLRSRVTGFGHHTLGRIAFILLTGWSVGHFGFSGLARFEGTVLMTGLAGWGLFSFFLSIRRRKGALRKRLSLLCWLAAPGLIVWYISLWQPLFTDRYLVWSALAFCLLVAVGLAALWRLGGWRQGLALFLVVLVLAFNGANQWLQATKPGKVDFRGAVAYVAERYGAFDAQGERAIPVPSAPATCEDCTHHVYLPNVAADAGAFDELIVFQIPYARYGFNYYFPNRDYAWAEGLYTNHVNPDGSYVMSAAQAAEEMARMTEGYRVVWLFATEAEMWDQRGLVKGWLDAHMHLTEKAAGEYLWVDVYRYEK
jgi:mannosyltransferase